MSRPPPPRILVLLRICVALLMGGCAHGDFWATAPEDHFPDSTAPAYPGEVLKARAERMRAVERWERSLEGLNRLIEFRGSARVSRDPSGNILGALLRVE